MTAFSYRAAFSYTKQTWHLATVLANQEQRRREPRRWLTTGSFSRSREMKDCEWGDTVVLSSAFCSSWDDAFRIAGRVLCGLHVMPWIIVHMHRQNSIGCSLVRAHGPSRVRLAPQPMPTVHLPPFLVAHSPVPNTLLTAPWLHEV